MTKMIRRPSDKKTERDAVCLEGSPAEHRETGAGPKSQRSRAKMQSEKLQGEEREGRRGKGEGQQTPEGARDTGTAATVTLPAKEQNGHESGGETTGR